MAQPNEPVAKRRQSRGMTAYLSGAAAEGAVAKQYERAGWTILERRWRGEAGEIDLIVARGDVMAFVEVKKSKTKDAAIASLHPRQLARIAAAAEVYFLQLDETEVRDMRIDLAAVDGAGRVEILENLTLW